MKKVVFYILKQGEEPVPLNGKGDLESLRIWLRDKHGVDVPIWKIKEQYGI